MNVPSGTMGSFFLHSSCRASFTGMTLFISVFFPHTRSRLKCQLSYLRNVKGYQPNRNRRGSRKSTEALICRVLQATRG